jgi:hypothetical protein
MSWLIEFGKYMVAFTALVTSAAINIHVRHMEEKELEEMKWESTGPST